MAEEKKAIREMPDAEGEFIGMSKVNRLLKKVRNASRASA
jgi:hypothetical protein